ncbi:hypothetical protein HZC27_04495 [Candidatus Roizmanbacteria bacterium]|nr:hypothetical protein [Candidatus Roizmanbacteria bacterium]
MNNSKDLSNQVISPEEVVVEPTGATSSMNVLELTTIINRYAADIDKVKGSLKEKNSMFKDAFEGDAKYHEQDMKVKDLTKLKNAEKQRILKTPAIEALTAQVNDLKMEMKDMQDLLSGYLEQYQKVSGTNIIETENGDIREIIPVFKLVKRRI